MSEKASCDDHEEHDEECFMCAVKKALDENEEEYRSMGEL